MFKVAGLANCMMMMICLDSNPGRTLSGLHAGRSHWIDFLKAMVRCRLDWDFGALGKFCFSFVKEMMLGDKETLLYVPCVVPDGKNRPDYLATVDVDPSSENYSKVCVNGSNGCLNYELHVTRYDAWATELLVSPYTFIIHLQKWRFAAFLFN